MAQNRDQRRASDAVARWLAQHDKGNAWLADAADADPGTIGDFLSGKRWPKLGTQGRIEKALGWPVGIIRQIGNGAAVPESLFDDPADASVGGSSEDADYVASPGEIVRQDITNHDLMAELLRQRADYDQLRAEVRTLSERVERIESDS